MTPVLGGRRHAESLNHEDREGREDREEKPQEFVAFSS
jgi:hypothetical protein